MILFFCKSREQKTAELYTLNKTEISTAFIIFLFISHQTVQNLYDVPHICKQDE